MASPRVRRRLFSVEHLEDRTVPTSFGFSTLLGGAGSDQGAAIAVDAAGNSYVAGGAYAGFPVTPGAYDTTYNGAHDAFVAKFNSSGALVWATYLGGPADEMATGIAVDGAGDVFVTGPTSGSFPTTPGAFQPAFAGGGQGDSFVAKLNAAGTSLLYSTYLGGSGDEYGISIAVDSSGNAFIGGSTRSSNYPTTAGAFMTSKPGFGGVNSAVVSKLNATGTALIYSTYLGGTNFSFSESVDAIAVDATGNAYVTGLTSASDFPTTSGAFQSSMPGGGNQPFVAKLNAAGSGLVYSTYLGSSGGTSMGVGGVGGIAVDSSGSAYVTGATESPNFPTTPGAFQTSFGGGSEDAFVSKLNAAGSALVFSTYLGGSGDDYPSPYGGAIAVDGAGNVFVTGKTSSANFPTASPVQSTYGGSFDVYVARLNASGSTVLGSTFLGGSGTEDSYPVGGIAVDSVGNAYVTGSTTSSDFPTANAIQATNAGGDDVFVAKIVAGAATTGHIFVTSVDSGWKMGEYTSSGATVNASLVTTLNNPRDIAVSGGNLFVANAGNGTIGEYTAAGATVNTAIVSGLNGPTGIAASGGNLFVVNAGNGTIGEYTTSGATVNAVLVTGLNNPSGIVVSGGNLFVLNAGNGTIGEYTTSGATVNAALVSGLNTPFGIAVSGGNLFVTNYNSNTIGEYTTSGATVNAALVSGLNRPIGIAVFGGNLFVTNQGNNTIGEYTTSGATVNAALISSGFASPYGIAVAPEIPEAIPVALSIAAADITYNGSAYATSNITPALTPVTAAGTTTFTFYSDAGGTIVIPAPTNSGTYYVKGHFTSSDLAQWSDADSSIVGFTIAKATSTTTTLGDGPFTYDGTTHAGGSGTVTGVGPGVITLDFENVTPNAGNGTAYLNSYGITLTNITPSGPAGVVDIFNNSGPGSHWVNDNFLTQNGGGAPPCSYTMNFSTPLQSISFERIATPFDLSTEPQWSATAYAGLVPVGTVGESLDTWGNSPAHSFTLTGNGITSLTISSNGFGFTGIGAVPLDNFVLTQVAGGFSTSATSLTYSANADGTGTADRTDAGAYYITAHYAGDANHFGSDGAAVAITIGRAGLTVTPTDATRVFGAANPSFSGTVSGVQASDAIVATYGTAATAESPVGTYDITAMLSDPDNRLGNYDVTLNVGHLSVTPASTTTSASVSAPTPLYGVDGLTVSAAISVVPPGSGAPTGLVFFYDGASLLGTASVVDGIAALVLSSTALSVGPHTIEAVYGGSSNFAGSDATVAVNVLGGSSVQGLVYVDFNNDGQVDFGERVVAGVTVTLTGTDDLGQAVNASVQSDANGVYLFPNLRPSNSAGYTIAEAQPAGYPDGIDSLGTINNVATGVAGSDAFSGIVISQGGSLAENYNFGERPTTTGNVTHGQTAGIGFWQNKNGQNLIQALNGGSSATQLGHWLAATFPNMYASLDGMSNSGVAGFYKTLFSHNGNSSLGGPPKTDAQIMATALAVYVTNQTLAGNTATAYGFQVTADGVGSRTFNVGTRGAAFGAANNSFVSVMDLLLAVNARSHNGLLYDMDSSGQISNSEASYRTMANDLFSAINEAGGV